MEKLKLKLLRIENVVLMKILKQDELTRGSISFKGTNGFHLSSGESPELDGNYIFLRGREKDNDDILYSRNFYTEVEANDYIKEIVKLVKEYNESITTNEVKDNRDIVSVIIAE